MQASGGQWQSVILVAQQHHAGSTGRAHQGPVFGFVTGDLGAGTAIGDGTDGVHEANHTVCRFSDGKRAHETIVHGSTKLGATMLGWARHLQVEAGVDPFGSGVQAKPVTHHDAAEAPLAAQDGGDQLGMVGGMGTVDSVVRRHDGQRPGFRDGGLERNQIQLTQRALVDLAVNGETFELGVVAHIVLDARRHPF